MLVVAALCCSSRSARRSRRGEPGGRFRPARDASTRPSARSPRRARRSSRTPRTVPSTRVVGPGYLPCPDPDDDGWAESTCGSLARHLGQAERLGRLPWKTLGLPDLRDGRGERLWYAVSTRYKGLLNCAASRACVDMSPAAALGTITVRDASGRVLHDGTLADPARANEGGAAAVVIAPAPGRHRGTTPISSTEATPAGRAGNANGFTSGSRDRIAAIGYGDVNAARDAPRGARSRRMPSRAPAGDGLQQDQPSQARGTTTSPSIPAVAP